MKGSSCSFVASVFAASTTALASSSAAAVAGDVSFTPCCCDRLHSGSSAKSSDTNSATGTTAGKDKFAPRFDGLRFIETLVTAHR